MPTSAADDEETVQRLDQAIEAFHTYSSLERPSARFMLYLDWSGDIYRDAGLGHRVCTWHSLDRIVSTAQELARRRREHLERGQE